MTAQALNARIALNRMLDGLTDSAGIVCGNISSAPIAEQAGPLCADLALHTNIAVLVLLNSDHTRHTIVLHKAQIYFQVFDLFRVVGQVLTAQLTPSFAFPIVKKTYKSTSDAISELIKQSSLNTDVHFCRFQIKLLGLLEALASRHPFEAILLKLGDASNVNIINTFTGRRDSWHPSDNYIFHLRVSSGNPSEQEILVNADVMFSTTLSSIDKWPFFRTALQSAGHFET